MPHPLFRLGNRLALCASMVREGTKLADVGTDHAYLPIWLARKGRVSSAIAADVKPLPLRSAEQNIRRYYVEEQVTTRLSDGLRALSPDEADDIVLAGMGGELIIRLIGEAPWLKAGDKRLILQPMTSAEELRRFLERRGLRSCASRRPRRTATSIPSCWWSTAPRRRAAASCTPISASWMGPRRKAAPT